MFEKEAYEYAVNTRTQKEIEVLNTVQDWGSESLSPEERYLWKGIRDREVAREQGFKDGAELGYNKANEWHYVKDELPDEGTYLVVWQNDNGYKEIFIMNYEEDDEEELHWVDGDCEVQDEYIIAWKEIVFPELKESE